MYGSGIYSLQAVKEVKVTEGFKSLKADQKKCQTSESLGKDKIKKGNKLEKIPKPLSPLT